MKIGNDILPMKNEIQEYAWGSKPAIAALCGQPGPSSKPQAEFWMGAHPKAPSRVLIGDRWERLDRLMEADPQAILGKKAAARFRGRLPFLFKVLAAAEPLSIQAHPSQAQAVEGYEMENAAGIPINAPHRNYRDPNAKPEIICALTPFWGMNGFRSVASIREHHHRYCPMLSSALPDGVDDDADAAQEKLRSFFRHLMGLDAERCSAAIDACIARMDGTEPDLENWILRLNEHYPGDVGVLSPLWLNLVCLSPGEAMFLPAGQLHAYLEGTGIELMANSDNVLRGGLTPKHVDVPELMKVLRFVSTPVEKRYCRPLDAHVCQYDTPAEDFQLSVIQLKGGGEVVTRPGGTVQILLATSGTATVTWGNGAGQMTLTSGASALVPAKVGEYSLSGSTQIFVAGVP